MKIIPILQIMSILYFIFAVRMQMWKISLNSFIVISTVFILAVSSVSRLFNSIWLNYHLTVIVIMLTFIMVRTTWQSIHDKNHRRVGGRRNEDKI